MQKNNSILGSALMKAMEDIKNEAPKNKVISKKDRQKSEKVAAAKYSEFEARKNAAILKQKQLFLESNTRAINSQVSGVKIILLAKVIEAEFSYYLTEFRGFGKAKQLSKRIAADTLELVKEINRNGINFLSEVYGEDNVDDDAGELWDFVHTLFMIGFDNMKATVDGFKKELPKYEQEHKDRVKAMAMEAAEKDLLKWIKKNNL